MVTALQIELPAERLGRALGQVVKYVKVALASSLLHHPRFLEQIRVDRAAVDEAFGVELNADEFAEARRIVVACGGGVAKGLQDWIRPQQLILELAALEVGGVGQAKTYRLAAGGSDLGRLFLGAVGAFARRRDVRNILNDLFGVLGFARTRLSGAQDGLINLLLEHVTIRLVGHRKDVRRAVLPSPTLVGVDDVIGVDREPLERVHNDHEEARVRVDEVRGIAILQVVQHCGLVEIG
mmetsp:Transcript_36119/g.108461  ORF Transcript_36119/g.108461 Transcript_36119/m.108461 type:complete len:238 (+) Transcript_36119:2148-2861(+)